MLTSSQTIRMASWLSPMGRIRDDWGMKYWTLFSLRVLAGAGLSVAVGCWLVSQWHPLGGKISFGSTSVMAGASEQQMFVNVIPSLTMWLVEMEAAADEEGEGTVPPMISIPGFQVYRNSFLWSVGVSHWLLCLAFLMLTVLTSWRWRKLQAAMEGTDA